jgi:hypothetical protein
MKTKKSLLTAVLVFATMTGFAQNDSFDKLLALQNDSFDKLSMQQNDSFDRLLTYQNDLFDKLSEQKDITQVSVTKAVLNMAPNIISSASMNGVSVKDVIDKLERIDIFISADGAAKKLMRKETTTYFKFHKSYELLMKIKDEESNIVFYGQKEGNFIKSLVMFVDNNDSDECVLIRLLGKFAIEDIQKITKSVKL